MSNPIITTTYSKGFIEWLHENPQTGEIELIHIETETGQLPELPALTPIKPTDETAPSNPKRSHPVHKRKKPRNR